MLTEYSKQVEAGLCNALPWLRPHVQRESEGKELDYSLMYVPCPHGGERMYIYTDDEITIGRGAWHLHIGDEAGDVDGQIDAAVELINQIMTDELVPVDQFRGAKWSGCESLRPGDIVVPKPGETAYVRYWNKPTEEVRGPETS